MRVTRGAGAQSRLPGWSARRMQAPAATGVTAYPWTVHTRGLPLLSTTGR
ncbi:hypothetical protein OHA72_40670 [Dactylosporangium sp. NBC_01737]|nr:hypothetical protein OHA72_40670 [Dactylosporangium sp. NBC_01737]